MAKEILEMLDRIGDDGIARHQNHQASNGPTAIIPISRPASSSRFIGRTRRITNAPIRSRPARWTAAFTKSPSSATARWARASWIGPRPGDKLFVIPPVGKFLPVYEPNKHLICIAGGSGVTPFRAFAREATRRKLDTKITVLYSVRQPKDIIFNTRIPRAGKGKSEFQISRHLHARVAGGQLDRPHRRIDVRWVKEIAVTDLPNTVFYACGPNALVEFAEELVLQELGVPKEQMKTEKWG